jgi:hypothetical protein
MAGQTDTQAEGAKRAAAHQRAVVHMRLVLAVALLARVALAHVLVAAGWQLHPVTADYAAVNHEAQREEHVALIRLKGLLRLRALHVDALLQDACGIWGGGQ